MEKMTITEALADIKTIGKRVEKKRRFISDYLVRQEMVRDPLEKDGGSASRIAAELQGIADLCERRIAIRRAVQEANARTMMEIGGKSRSIADWLVWRRELAGLMQETYAAFRSALASARLEAQKRGLVVLSPGVEGRPQDLIVNIDEGALGRETEKIEETLGKLDGLLSLKNATVTIEV